MSVISILYVHLFGKDILNWPPQMKLSFRLSGTCGSVVASSLSFCLCLWKVLSNF